MKKVIIIVCIGLSMFVTSCGHNQENGYDVIKETESNIQEIENSQIDDSQIEDSQKDNTYENVVPRENTDFRYAIWGDDAETVIKYEGEDYERAEDGSYVYERNVAGYDAYTIFAFDNNELHFAGYNFKDTYTVGSQYILQYNSLKNALTEKYGTPYEDEIISLEKQDLVDMAGESNALKYGYVAYRSQWNTGSSNIMLGMMAQNYEIGIVITYEDTGYEFETNTDGL